jgi:phosphoribosylformylglycinamidine synthase I
MHAVVVVFPGSNADTEMIRTLRDIVGVRTSVVWHRDHALPAGTDLVAIPGGFSYGDYLRCGAIAKTSPILADIRRHADRGGLVLGVCNGFQILTECGLLPGALTRNAHLRFECRDIFVRPKARGPFTNVLLDSQNVVLRLPIAHAEGRYQASPAVLSQLTKGGATGPAIAFEYVDASGNATTEANPNGSLAGIAGVYGGERRNVMGLMPHPERMSEAAIGGADGRLLFDAARATIAASVGAAAQAERAP